MTSAELETLATEAQRLALRRVFDRTPLAWNRTSRRPNPGERAMTFAEFTARAQYSHTMGCIMVSWLGMWLGIEPDGYTHS